ncbi:PAS domain S-box [Candidatus Rickettsiella viridis]|uniref:PAS domain S-box n=1 Tax=Candidatus Rickettsiella viridis TaxID=676208 RepID=A0A2Z5UUI6_9COXI|nr:hypothetical protein [Candidatus Rickettsiella viridis]BBB15134.1 PAS domain S-box [Candidatus Rickettsiella viridis]
MTKDIGKDGGGLQEVKKDDFLNRMPNHNYFAKDLNLRYIASECSDSTAMYAGVDSPKQLQGKSDYDLIWAPSAESFILTDRQALSNQPQINHKETVLVQNGFHDFLITKVKMYNRKEEVIGIVGLNICVDNFTISERKGKLDIEQIIIKI